MGKKRGLWKKRSGYINNAHEMGFTGGFLFPGFALLGGGSWGSFFLIFGL